MKNIYVREFFKIIKSPIIYWVLLFLILCTGLPLLILYDKVIFDPATFLNNYYSILTTSFLISIFIQIANKLQNLITKRREIIETLEKLDLIYVSFEEHIENNEFEDIESKLMLIDSMKRKCRKLRCRIIFL